MAETVVITETINSVVISTPGPQGTRGKTILNGTGIPSSNLGLEGDFYYDKSTTRLYGPKLSDSTWDSATNYLLSSSGTSLKFAADIGDNNATTFTVTHGLNTRNVVVQIFENQSPYAQVETDVEHVDVNNVTIKFAVKPTTSQYKIVILG